MFNFIREYKKTIIFIIIIVFVIVGIYIYRRIQKYNYEYNPNGEPVPYVVNKYDSNQYTVKSMKESDVYRAYYKNFIRLLINDPLKAFDTLEQNCKEDMFSNDYEEFLKYVKSLDKNKLLSSDVSRYSKQKDKIIIIDSNEYSFVFYENGVWNYQVYLNGRLN